MILPTLLACLLSPAGAADPSFPDAQKHLEELAKAVSEAKRTLAEKPKEKGGDQAYVRLPTLELFATKEASALGVGGYRLTDAELADARTVFGEAVDLEPVRWVYVSAAMIGNLQTSANVIRVPPGLIMERRAVIHEIVHVWQYQNRGLSYVSDSFLHSVCSLVTSGKRDSAYTYTLVPEKSLFDYTAEQQGQIVEDYFAGMAKLKDDPVFSRLIAQLRATRPMKDSVVLFQDLAAGLPPRGRGPDPLPNLSPLPNAAPPADAAGAIPQFEFRFKGL